jgi:2-keto-4-pentenoate hydratase
MTDHDIAKLLLDARTGAPVATGIIPADEAQAYRVQQLVMAELGPIGGWKVGAPGPDEPPTCAPMPQANLFAAPHGFDSAVFSQREVESEIFFRLGTDLPAQEAPYTREEVVAAIASCHPGIEVLQSRYADPDAAGALALLADFIQHGAYVTGQEIGEWEAIDFAAMTIRQTIAGGPIIERVGNPAGDMIRLLVWLANTGSAWAGGLRAGQVLTCGSWTGKTRAPADSTVTADFSGAAPVAISFAQP